MEPENDDAYNKAKQTELFERVESELKVHEGRNFLERFALYMARVQMYELSLVSQRFKRNTP